MAMIEFSQEEKADIVRRIQLYFTEELDQQIGQFDAEFLLDFFSEEVGTYYYNRGVQDARLVLADRIEAVSEAMDEIEKPLPLR